MTEHTRVHNSEENIDVETQRVMEEIKKELPLSHTEEKIHLDSSVVRPEEEEPHRFDAQVDSLLSILINSVYSSKDYFLRELLSNASDAIDKRKKLAHAKGEAVNEEMSIKIVPNAEGSTLTIVDTGVGMTKADMVNYLGSIATSGTKEFKKKLAENKDGDMGALIGQFGLGFYSAFLVADQVDVISKHEDDVPHIWSSRGPGGFVIAPYHTSVQQGTTVVLHIASKCAEYLKTKKLEDIVKVHSSFIEYPISLFVTTEKTRKVPKKEKEACAGEGEQADTVEEVKEEEEKEEEETYQEQEFKHLNEQPPLWAKNPRETKITEEEYESFYKAFTNDWEKYFAVNHSFVEGEVDIQTLLFIQNRPPFNMFEKKKKNTCNIKLYVQNVLVSNDLSEVIPEWVSFVHGVVSSKDIPINVSREVVQGHAVMNLIKRVVIKKVLDMIRELEGDEEKYMKFYKNFASYLKMGVYYESSDVSKKLSKFLRFFSTKSGEKMVSFDEYVKNMAEGQKQIYVLTGINIEEMKKSPFLEKLQKYEVLYLSEPVDEFVIQNMQKYGDFDIQRITSDGLELPEESADVKQIEEEYKDFLAAAKEVLGEGVEKIVISPLLKQSACSVSSSKYAYSGAMEHIMKYQPGAENNVMAKEGIFTRRVFEINPEHSIIHGLKSLLGNGKREEFNQGLKLIYETSLLACGYPVGNMAEFATKVFGYIKGEMEKVQQ
ncbi:molecular chaperone HtpG [Nematocida sp. AWRm77]|nr:molecular chaperone HtpG [Nematocida sp. AWRm77]